MTHNLVILLFSSLVATSMGELNTIPAIDPTQMSVRASGNIASTITQSDYPYRAMQRGERGLVAFKIRTDLEGRISHCEVTKSSGSKILDSTTCRLLKARGKLSPALDLQRRPTPDELTGAINWEL